MSRSFAEMCAQSERPDSAPVGLQVANYHVLRPIVAGAQRGRVYLGHHKLLGFPVAIKCVRPQSSAEAEQEVGALMALTAVGCGAAPALLDVGELPAAVGGGSYLVTEHVPGETLGQILHQERRLGARRVLRLAVRLLAALEAVHCAGWVHADIKPDNIVVTRTPGEPERCVLIDFGASRRIHSGAAPQTQPPSVTRSLLTPEYASPEVAQYAGLSPATDVFSVGCVVYECLAGARPDLSQVVDFGRPVEPLARVVPVTSPLSEVLARSLAPEPEARYPSAAAFAQALCDIPPESLFEDCHQRWAALPGQQESLDTVDISDVGRRIDSGVRDSQPWAGDRAQLLSTGTPEVWAFTGDPAMDQPELRLLIERQARNYAVAFLDAEAREAKHAEYLAGRAPPAVAIFGDLHVLLKEPLLEALGRQGETARLLVSTHENVELLQSTINDCGLNAQLCVPGELEQFNTTLKTMVGQAWRVRQRYDWLRLALRDTQADLRSLQYQFARGRA